MRADHFFQLPCVGREDLVAEAVPLHGPFHGFVGLGKEPARVEGEDPRLGSDRAHEMGQDLVLDAQARREHKPVGGKNPKRFPDRSFRVLALDSVLKFREKDRSSYGILRRPLFHAAEWDPVPCPLVQIVQA